MPDALAPLYFFQCSEFLVVERSITCSRGRSTVTSAVYSTGIPPLSVGMTTVVEGFDDECHKRLLGWHFLLFETADEFNILNLSADQDIVIALNETECVTDVPFNNNDAAIWQDE